MKVGFLYTQTDDLLEFIQDALKTVHTVNAKWSDECEVCFTNRFPTEDEKKSIGRRPIILCVSNNPLASDVDAFMGGAYEKCQFSAILLSETQKEYKSYLETVFDNTQVIVVPHLIRNAYTLSKPVSTKATGKLNIVILNERNNSFNTCAWRSLNICEQFYATYTELVDCIYIFNIDDTRKTTVDMLESLKIRKEKKLRYFKHMAHTDVMNYFYAQSSQTVFLTNQIYDDVDPVYFDAMINGFAVVHSSALLKSAGLGVYYNHIDISDAVKRISGVLAEPYDMVAAASAASAFCAARNANKPKLLEIVNAVLGIKKTPALASLMYDAQSKTLNILDTAAPLAVIAVAEGDDYGKLKSMLEAKGWQYLCIKAESAATRPQMHKAMLSRLPASKVVAIVNAPAKTYCLRTPAEFMNDYTVFKSPIVLAMESTGVVRGAVNGDLVCGLAGVLAKVYEAAVVTGVEEDRAVFDALQKSGASVATDADAKLLHTSMFGIQSAIWDSPTIAELHGYGASFLHIPSDRVYKSTGAVLV